MMNTVGEWWMWIVFFAFIAFMLCIDFFLMGGKKAHRVSTKEALGWTILWVTLSLLFNFLFWIYLNHTAGLAIANQRSIEFLTGYLIEKSLSIDNIFIILLVFNFFAIPHEYQRRILMLGIIGAIVMRLILILFGIWAVNQFAWILYIFGAFLFITGIKMFVFAEHKPDLSTNPVLLWMRNHLRITNTLHNERFYIIQNKLVYFTPLFVALVFVEITDLIFAVDSIPAIFAVTNDPFIIFTSNIFAILGLRALYFVLARMHSRFHFLKYGLALILVFIGIKMLIAHWIKIPSLTSFAVIIFILTISIFCSLCCKKD